MKKGQIHDKKNLQPHMLAYNNMHARICMLIYIAISIAHSEGIHGFANTVLVPKNKPRAVVCSCAYFQNQIGKFSSWYGFLKIIDTKSQTQILFSRYGT